MIPPDDTKHLDALDAIYDHVAEVDAQDGASTPEDQVWADGVRKRVNLRLAALRRRLVPDVDVVSASPIRPDFLAMTRDVLLSRIAEISGRMGGTVQIAHRRLSDLTDDDLRRLLETLAGE